MVELQDIHGSDWNYLIVLDACRFDIFEQVYEEYFEGKLERKKSRGSGTAEWLWKSFTSRYNYEYISANPFINSYGIPLSESFKGCEEDWKPTEKFRRIVDSWEQDWDDQLGTVHPEDLTDTALEHETDRKTIIHYIQPHRPYISCPEDRDGNVWEANERIAGEGEENSAKRKLIDSTRTLWEPVFRKLPYSIKWKVKQIVGVEQTHFGKLIEEIGEEKVKQHYRQDLEMTLEQIQRLVEETDGKVIITADHGESFGENGEWGHELGSHNPVLLEVPWLEVESVKR